MMQRLVAFDATKRTISKVFFSNSNNLLLLRQSSSFSHIHNNYDLVLDDDLQKEVISVLGNAAPCGRCYQITNSDLNLKFHDYQHYEPSHVLSYPWSDKDVFPKLCRFKDLGAAKQLLFKMIADGSLRNPKTLFEEIITAYVEAGEVRQALEMVILMESKGLCTCCDTLIPDYQFSIDHLKMIRKILEEAKRKDDKLIIALLYHTLIFGYCMMLHFGEALQLLTEMKGFGVSCTYHDEYLKLIHSLHLKAMDRKMSREKLEEMEPMDRAMAEKKLDIMDSMDWKIIEGLLEGMHLNIRASFG